MSRRSLVLGAACGCLAIGLAWAALIVPAQRRASSSGTQIGHLRNRLAVTAALAPRAELPAGGGSPKISSALRRAMPGRPMGGNVIAALAHAAAETGLDLRAVSLGAPGSGDSPVHARSIPVRFEVRGSYKQTVGFLDRLEALVSRSGQHIRASGRLISIDSVSIDSGAGQKPGGALLARMRGSAYTMSSGRSGP